MPCPSSELLGWLAAFRDAVHEHGAYLTELDSAIGDADHGANLIRGMDAVMAAVDSSGDLGELLKKVGMTLVTSVGGASGPLYGTFFLRAAAAAADASALDGPALLAVLRAGLEGIVARGKAEAGDKTMYDALAPGLDAFVVRPGRRRGRAGAARAAADAAAAGRDATEPMLALKGRAVVPRRAERRPHRPGRRLVHPAARGSCGRPRSHDRDRGRLAQPCPRGGGGGAGREMVHGAGPVIAVAAGAGGGFGTDATEVSAALDRAASPDGVLVLMDLGSAVLSAELSLSSPRRRTRSG
jgi:dihydroxyacetone kinase-like protein